MYWWGSTICHHVESSPWLPDEWGGLAGLEIFGVTDFNWEKEREQL
jgi:hypothetical protein